MSTFNTHKDRKPDGMPKPHKHPRSCWIGANPEDGTVYLQPNLDEQMIEQMNGG
jgi:hypothetical protein